MKNYQSLLYLAGFGAASITALYGIIYGAVTVAKWAWGS